MFVLKNRNGLELSEANFPTRYENLLDILLTNRPSFMGTVDRVPGVSDHQGVLATSLVKARYRRPVKRGRSICGIAPTLTQLEMRWPPFLAASYLTTAYTPKLISYGPHSSPNV